MSAFLIKSLIYIVGSLVFERPAFGLPLAAFIGIVVIGYHKARRFPPLTPEFPPEIPEPFVALLQQSVETGAPVSIHLKGTNHHRLVRILFYDRQRIKGFDLVTELGVTYHWPDIDLDGSGQ